jgi:hypothetical protein
MLVVFATPLPAHSQSFSFGLKAGVPLTGTPYTLSQIADGGDFASAKRFAIGPTAEIRLPFHVSFEIDALWRQSSFGTIGGHFNGNLDSSVNDWQVPLLAKYERKLGPLGSFIDAGVVYRHVSTTGSNVAPPSHPSTTGISAGGGVTLKPPHLRLSPEIRYTYWPTPAFGSTYTPVQSTRNQADLLVGITF